MKKTLSLFLCVLFIASQCFAATGWKVDQPEDDDYIDEGQDNILENFVALDLMLSKHRQGCFMSADTDDQFTVGSGGVMLSNSGGTTRLMVANTSSTTVTFSNLDTGAEAASTTYYAYAYTNSTTATTFSIFLSASSSAPAGATYYRRLGSIYNDTSSNITLVTNDDVIPTKFYDSGWYAVSLASTTTKIHNLGTTKLLTQLYYASDANGTGMRDAGEGERSEYGGEVKGATTTTLTTQAGSVSIFLGYKTTGGKDDVANSGYYRVFAMALE